MLLTWWQGNELHFSRVTEADTGIYTCYLDNFVQPVVSYKFSLMVEGTHSNHSATGHDENDDALSIITFSLINKRRAVAAQTARSRCKVLSIQYVYYFRTYQRQRTLHGVGVITKLYFAIFATFMESMTLNLAHRSFKVIDFGTNRNRVYT